MTEQNPAVKRYLEEFRKGLVKVEPADRDEIVREIESHIADALNAGQSVAAVLERLGSADRLARAMAAASLLESPGRKRLRRWLDIASLVALYSLPSLLMVGFFGLLMVVGTVGFFAGFAALGMSLFRGTLSTDVPGFQFPGGAYIVGVLMILLFAGMVIGSNKILGRYLFYVIRISRKVLG